MRKGVQSQALNEPLSVSGSSEATVTIDGLSHQQQLLKPSEVIHCRQLNCQKTVQCQYLLYFVFLEHTLIAWHCQNRKAFFFHLILSLTLQRP